MLLLPIEHIQRPDQAGYGSVDRNRYTELFRFSYDRTVYKIDFRGLFSVEILQHGRPVPGRFLGHVENGFERICIGKGYSPLFNHGYGFPDEVRHDLPYFLEIEQSSVMQSRESGKRIDPDVDDQLAPDKVFNVVFYM